MLDYPIRLTSDDNNTILVTFLDLPAHTFGRNRTAALRHAQNALMTILAALIKDHRPIPLPSAGRLRVAVPVLAEIKIRLYWGMDAAQVTKAELGRRLGWHPPQVDRILALTHASRLDRLEAAFDAIGQRVSVTVVAADVS